MKVRFKNAVCFAMVALGSSVVSLATTVDYNTVAAYNPNGTTLTNATGSDTVSSFSTAVASAFTSNTGGVINFDLANANSSVTGFNAAFGASAGKSMLITPSVTMSDQSFSQSSPTSGGLGVLPTASTDETYTLTFGSISGGNPGEVVRQIGIAILGRGTNLSYPLAVTVTAHLSDGSTQSASASVQGTKGSNVFYGLTAPASLGINSLSITAPHVAGSTDQRIIFDDLGFITGVPEPTSVALLSLTGLALLPRSRRAH